MKSLSLKTSFPEEFSHSYSSQLKSARYCTNLCAKVAQKMQSFDTVTCLSIHHLVLIYKNRWLCDTFCLHQYQSAFSCHPKLSDGRRCIMKQDTVHIDGLCRSWIRSRKRTSLHNIKCQVMTDPTEPQAKENIRLFKSRLVTSDAVTPLQLVVARPWWRNLLDISNERRNFESIDNHHIYFPGSETPFSGRWQFYVNSVDSYSMCNGGLK